MSGTTSAKILLTIPGTKPHGNADIPGKTILPRGTETESDGQACSEVHVDLVPQQSVEIRASPCMHVPATPTVALPSARLSGGHIGQAECLTLGAFHVARGVDGVREAQGTSRTHALALAEKRSKTEKWHQLPNLRHHVGSDGVPQEVEG
jgi:hypothetical protein